MNEKYHFGVSNWLGLRNSVRDSGFFPNFPEIYHEELRELHAEIITWIDLSINPKGVVVDGDLKPFSKSLLAHSTDKILEQAQNHSGKEWHEMEDIIYSIINRYIRGIRYATKQWEYDRYLYEKERKSPFFDLNSFFGRIEINRGGYYLPLLSKTQDDGFNWVIENDRKEILENLVESYIQENCWHSSFLEKLLCHAMLKCDIYEYIYEIQDNSFTTKNFLLEKKIDILQESLADLELKAGWVFHREHRIIEARKQLDFLRNYDSFNRMLKISVWLSRPWIQPENILRAIESDFEKTGLEYRDSFYNLLNHVVRLGHRWYP